MTRLRFVYFSERNLSLGHYRDIKVTEIIDLMKCRSLKVGAYIKTEAVCDICFSKYITTKVVKSIESYKLRSSYGQVAKKLLLPLSFGASSSALLSILDEYLHSQDGRTGRIGNKLHIVHIDTLLDEADRADSRSRLKRFEDRFPNHEYSIMGLETALQMDDIDWGILDIRPDVTSMESMSDSDKLQYLLGILKSATSRTDLISTLMTRLLVAVAQRMHCEAILFGDTTTRLAERTLTETAKGRGFSLPWKVSDGMSPFGIPFYYPLRNVLKKEITAFVSKGATPLLHELVICGSTQDVLSVSAKTTTIDNLLTQYFESVETNYPSVVANVVKTTSKLQSAPVGDAAHCVLCGLLVAPGTNGLHGWAGDQTSVQVVATLAGRTDAILCYGCSRSIQD